MKESIIFLPVALAVLFISCAFAPPAGAVDKDMEKKIGELEERIRILEKEKKERLEEEKEINQRLDEVEKKSILDKTNLGAEVRTRFDWFKFKDNQVGIDDNCSIPSTRFRLNLSSDVSKNLQFHSRLTMFANWNDNDTPSYNSLKASRQAGDNSLRVERAYADYFFDFMPMALTIGRLPLGDSLPNEFRENTPRKGSYPALAYDLEGDGVALSFGLEDQVSLPGAAFRLIYLRNVQDNDSAIYRNDTLDVGDFHIWVGQLEIGLTGELEDTLIVLNYVYLPELVPISAASLGTVAVTPLPESMGKFHKITLLIQSKRFLKSPVDWFAVYSYNEIRPDGPPANYVGIGTIGLFSSDNAHVRKGHGWQLGARFNFAFEKLNDPKLGIEYNRNSKYFRSGSVASEDPLNKNGVNGDAWDLYYIQPIDRNFFIRLGYTNVQRDRAESFLAPYGDVVEIDQKIENTYVLANISF
jgi:hypothetical protein